ncbi:hypothetical protein RT97_05050 [Variovorax paradoxus]|uniref:Uncharacterized protein n=1 Tax=Variovorax paradoxus TaxID=34073 RepID=A0A0D0MWH9_VARPD|nr:hypothetical protein [Variovorax paradoxus]KIQ35279.1 hypothetical protein RT97_05050 [Variovorax paradoxus]
MTVETAFGAAALGAVAARDQWETRLLPGPDDMGGTTVSMDICWGTVLMCRLLYAGPSRTTTQVHRDVQAAQDWIVEYETRPSPAMPEWHACDGKAVASSNPSAGASRPMDLH